MDYISPEGFENEGGKKGVVSGQVHVDFCQSPESSGNNWRHVLTPQPVLSSAFFFFFNCCYDSLLSW